MYRWMWLILLMVDIGVIGLMDNQDNYLLKQNSVRPENYMGLDGELSALPFTCSTCAVIGTSGHLLNHTYGSEIDQNHSCIFRLGFSPTRNMEQFVGARTTARIVDSFSFFPFLKRPWKLMSGSFNSKTWILFDRRPGDISWFHRPMLSSVVNKYDTKFLWVTKGTERQIFSNLLNKQKNWNRHKTASALWFALNAAKDAGCTSLNVYGIPDHQICKRHFDVAEPSLYWESRSQPLCRNGVDASFADIKSASFVAKIPTIPERRSLVDWVSNNIGEVHFHAPHWPVL